MGEAGKLVAAQHNGRYVMVLCRATYSAQCTGIIGACSPSGLARQSRADQVLFAGRVPGQDADARELFEAEFFVGACVLRCVVGALCCGQARNPKP